MLAGQKRQERDRDQGHADGHDGAPPEPVGEGAGREGHGTPASWETAISQPIVERLSPDRLQVEVEVDPVEAQRRAEDDGRQQEEPRVAAEAREAADVSGERSVTRVPSGELRPYGCCNLVRGASSS